MRDVIIDGVRYVPVSAEQAAVGRADAEVGRLRAEEAVAREHYEIRIGENDALLERVRIAVGEQTWAKAVAAVERLATRRPVVCPNCAGACVACEECAAPGGRHSDICRGGSFVRIDEPPKFVQCATCEGRGAVMEVGDARSDSL